MNLIKIFLVCSLFIFSCTESRDEMKEQLEELKIHLSHGNISETLHNKLKGFIESGGLLDSDDWLFYIQKKFADESSLDIQKLQERRYTEIEFVEASIVEILKKAGFFAQSSFIPQKPTFHMQQRELVERSVKLASQDYSKLMHFDVEGDVWEGNKAYIGFLHQIKDFTQGHFSPVDIEEIWESSEGPIAVKYRVKGQSYSFNPEYHGDWYDLPDVFGQINEVLSEESYGLYTISAEYVGGQDLAIFFINKDEKEILERELDWQLELLY